MEDFVKSILSKAEALDAEKRKAVAEALHKAADELVKAAPMGEDEPREKADVDTAGSTVEAAKSLDGGWPSDLAKSIKGKE